MKIAGKNAVMEALRSGVTIDTLLVEKGTNHEIVSRARKANIKIQYVDKNILDKRSPDVKHQGFIAETSEFNYSTVEEILAAKKDKHFIVILDGLEAVLGYNYLIGDTARCEVLLKFALPNNN